MPTSTTSVEFVPHPARNPGCVCHLTARLRGNWDACRVKCEMHWKRYNPRVTMEIPYCQWSCICDRLTVRENVSCCGPEVLR